MRILIVNTSEKTGGAALASNRLVEALNRFGIETKMLVKDKETNNVNVVSMPHSARKCLHFLWERWCIFWHLHLSKKCLFAIDIANIGTDITQLPVFKQADVIHLEWINQGTLSLKNIQQIIDSGKPIVWTMHDIWPATAICHLSLTCQRFKQQCGCCYYLPNGGYEHDLSYKVWLRKYKVYGGGNIAFVACSHWLGNQAKQSGLLKNSFVTTIPNPIDTHVFAPKSREGAAHRLGLPTDKKLILFASQRITNVNKGISYLIEACRLLVEAHLSYKDKVALVVLGGHADEMQYAFNFPTYPLGYVNDTQKIVDVYNAVDMFVLPSLSENLPNTIMEAMSCGVPCVGFDVGGIPEMIEHKVTGFVAKYTDAQSLAEGIQWVLSEDTNYAELSRQCIEKVQREYSQQSVVQRYMEVYRRVMERKKK